MMFSGLPVKVVKAILETSKSARTPILLHSNSSQHAQNWNRRVTDELEKLVRISQALELPNKIQLAVCKAQETAVNVSERTTFEILFSFTALHTKRLGKRA